LTASSILTFVLAVIPAIIAITLHEAAHGYAAWALGDTTAKRMGRLSLNPLVHVDRVGTILLPGFLLVSQLLTIGHVSFMFGWAKPVPVNPSVFRSPRRGMALVAAAGPLLNFFLAWLAALSFHFVDALPDDAFDLAMQFIPLFIVMNLALGLFNLLPIPPLDGGRIAVGLLPLAAARVWARLERAGLVIVILVVFLLPRMLSELAHIRFNPVGDALYSVIPAAFRFVLMLAGVDDRSV